jgi:hypothetical protein
VGNTSTFIYVLGEREFVLNQQIDSKVQLEVNMLIVQNSFRMRSN